MATLLTFGESMLRFTPPDDERIERADAFDVRVGGAESNVAVAARRLGVDAAWASKLPASPPADRVVTAIRSHGVEPLVARSDEGRVGTYYLETGDVPRGSNVVYDREGAAVRSATPKELPLDRLRGADAFFTSGITPALSDRLAGTVAELFDVSNAACTDVAFDVNYRAKLWSPGEAREALRGLLPKVDVLFVAERDVESVLDRDGDPEAVARDLAGTHGCETVVVTRGADGALAVHDGTTSAQPAFEADSPHPVGSGDAFAGGFLATRLRGESVPEALAFGAATAALKRTVPGDVATVTRSEVEAVVEGDAERLSR